MADEGFQLPGSSLEEIEKIVEAHAQKGAPASNRDIAKISGASDSTVSRNNGFLVSVGLLNDGKKKEATELGRNLGNALHHEQEDDIAKYWQEVVGGSAFLSEQLTAVRVQKGVATDDLPGKILYNAGASKNKYTKTGAQAVVDLLVRAGLLYEDDGEYQVATESSEPAVSAEDEGEKSLRENGASSERTADVAGSGRTASGLQGGHPLQLAVNLQLQLPEFDDAKKYEELFKALREHLLDWDDQE